ncbi:MAG TPA: hypothetical protein VEQ59_04370 [Polyangiaceae bacterium]|nr:hypothetical protein [Polyangiaceae bacterium]
MKATRSAVLLLAAAGSWSWIAGCHEFHACDDGPCEPSSASDGPSAGDAASGGATPSGAGGAVDPTSASVGAAGGSPERAGGAGGSPEGAGGAERASAGASESGGNAAEAGAAGSPGNAECVFPRADCDESSFTGCEASLLSDIRNCGACRAHCAGACVDGVCKPFEVLAEEVWLPTTSGIALVSNEVYALSTGFENTLVRWSEPHGAQTLFSGNNGFWSVLSGVDRLYLFGVDGQLSSILLTGGAVSPEGLAADTGVVYDNALYAAANTGAPYRRSETSHQIAALPLPPGVLDRAHAWLAADSFDIALVTGDGTDDAPTYIVYYLDDGQQPSWVRVASGSGKPAQVRVERNAAYIDVVLAHDEGAADWQIGHELREVDFGGKTRVVTALTGLLDFELVSSRLYLSVQLPQQKSVLRVVAVDSPSSVLEVETSAAMASLTYAPYEHYFYFGDASLNRLSRLRNWVE